jgi:hypothetical protein
MMPASLKLRPMSEAPRDGTIIIAVRRRKNGAAGGFNLKHVVVRARFFTTEYHDGKWRNMTVQGHAHVDDDFVGWIGESEGATKSDLGKASADYRDMIE